MGDVYLAWDPGTNREVALKTRRGGSAERFVREAQLMASLDHPGIVRVLDAGVDSSGLAYYACERVEEARDLREAFRGLSLFERVELVRDAARAAGHAHAHGIVHRDLKPENVLVNPEGAVRLTDFGLASTEELERLTRTGALVGTPTHLAPEQWRALQGERVPIDPRSDVWALGVVLYEALSGGLPFEGASWMELSAKILAASPAPPSSLEPAVPRGLQRVCLRALRLNPDQRPADGDRLAEEIEGALSDAGGGGRARQLVVLVGAGLLLGAGLSAGYWGAVAGGSAGGLAPLGQVSSPEPEATLTAAPLDLRGIGELLTAARSQASSGDFSGGVKTLEAAYALGVRRSEVLGLRAELYRFLGEPPRAMADLNEALEGSESPDLLARSPDLLALRADLHRKQGRLMAAEEDVERALSLDPAHVSSLLVKADIFTARHETETGLLIVHGLVSKHPKRADVWSHRAALLTRAGKDDLALSDAKRALELDAKCGQAYWVLAAIYIERKENDLAREAVERGLEVDPGSAELWTNLGVVRMRVGDFPGAIRALERALEIHPVRALAFGNRGFAYQGLGRRKEAVRDFRQALQLLGRKSAARKPILAALRELEQEARVGAAALNPKAALEEAVRLRDRRSPELALPIVERVLQEQPDSVRANYLRGNLLVLMGQHRRALEPLSRAIELDSTRREHFNDRGLAYQALGDQERAIKDFDRVIKGWPEFSRGWSNRAIARRKAGDNAGALEDCNQALKLDPSYINGFVNRANVYVALKQLELAERDCDRALELQEHVPVYGLRGMIRQERGDPKGAQVDYERFLELAPPRDPRRPRIRRLLEQLKGR